VVGILCHILWIFGQIGFALPCHGFPWYAASCAVRLPLRLHVCFLQIDCLSSSHHRKLCALAMARLLSEANPQALQFVEPALGVITAALAEEAAGGEQAEASWEAENVRSLTSGFCSDPFLTPRPPTRAAGGAACSQWRV